MTDNLEIFGFCEPIAPVSMRHAGFWTDSSSSHQPSSDQKQVAEREQGEQLGAVLGEAAVAGLQVAELAFDDPERVLDLGPHHRDDPVDLFVDRVQRAALGRLAQFKR